jgi:hypothetical protein
LIYGPIQSVDCVVGAATAADRGLSVPMQALPESPDGNSKGRELVPRKGLVRHAVVLRIRRASVAVIATKVLPDKILAAPKVPEQDVRGGGSNGAARSQLVLNLCVASLGAERARANAAPSRARNVVGYRRPHLRAGEAGRAPFQ